MFTFLRIAIKVLLLGLKYLCPTRVRVQVSDFGYFMELFSIFLAQNEVPKCSTYI